MARAAGGSSRLPLGQSYRERRPAQALAGFASSAWIQRVPPDAASYTHRNVPNGSVEVRCLVGSVPQIVGLLTCPMVELIAPGSTIVGVRLRPGAAACVLGVPPSELADLALDAHEVWGRPAAVAGERIDGSASPEEAVGLLQELIVGRLADSAGPDLLVAEAVRLMLWQKDDVGALRSSLDISERQFRRRCQSAIGLAPKTLQRMLRFQEFLAHVQFALSHGRASAGDGLGLLAAEAGYADQSHLTRECMRLTGLTPRAFLRETRQHCGCGHEHRVSFMPLLQSRAIARPASI